MALRSVLGLLAAGSAGLASDPPCNDSCGSAAIRWRTCDFEAPVDIQCGSLDVPLDYTDEDAGTLGLSLAKVAAAERPSLGTILVNFGGPGNDATEMLGTLGPLLQNMTGGRHDLVGFDPRGVDKTLPLSCFETKDARAEFGAEFPTTILSDASDTALDELWTNTRALAETCAKQLKHADLVGTAFVARDMMKVVDALGEDGKLRYYGLSYGTVLGATAAKMFPNRVESMLLDGNLNTHNYYYGFQVDSDGLLGADAAWESYIKECMAAGDKCALSGLNSTAADLASTLSHIADLYRDSPATVGSATLDYSDVKNLYYAALSSPASSIQITALIANVVAHENLQDVLDFMSGAGAAASEGQWGIACGDTIPRAGRLRGVMPEVDYLLESSPLFGGVAPAYSMTCAQWPFRAKEVKTLDSEVETARPVLFVGNTYDPATPAHSAYYNSKLFPGSAVVEQEGYGHCAISQPSECTWKYISDYFINGTMPGENVKCKVDTPLFAPAASSADAASI